MYIVYSIKWPAFCVPVREIQPDSLPMDNLFASHSLMTASRSKLRSQGRLPTIRSESHYRLTALPAIKDGQCVGEKWSSLRLLSRILRQPIKSVAHSQSCERTRSAGSTEECQVCSGIDAQAPVRYSPICQTRWPGTKPSSRGEIQLSILYSATIYHVCLVPRANCQSRKRHGFQALQTAQKPQPSQHLPSK